MSKTAKTWLRTVGEGVVILVSILLAFAIDARWDLRQEQEQLASVLESLETGFSDNLTLLDDLEARLEVCIADLQSFVSLEPSDADRVPPDRAASLIQAITHPCNNNLNNDFLIALLDAQSLNSLDDPALREAIGGWRNTANAFSSWRERIRWDNREAKRALGRHAVLRPTLMNPIFPWDTTIRGDLGPPPGANPGALLAARADDEVVALAAAKVSDWRALQFVSHQLMRQQSEAVLALLRETRAT